MATISAITTDHKTATRPPDFNFKVISLPWGMALTHKAFGGTTSAYQALQDTGAWHDLYEDFIFDNEDDGQAFWAGQETSNQGTSEENAEDTNEQPILHYGPSVVGIHMSVETLLFPEMVEGENKVRYSWGFQGRIPIQGSHPGGGVILVGAHRFTAKDDSNFAMTLNSATKSEALSQMIAGNYSLIQQRIVSDTSAGADFLRTMLFAGDENTEADHWNDSDIRIHTKLHAVISTPYSRIGAV